MALTARRHCRLSLCLHARLHGEAELSTGETVLNVCLWRCVVPKCPVCGMQCSPTSSGACQGHGPSPGVPCRDLSKPMGALNASRLAKFRLRFEEMPRGEVRPCQVPASLIPEVTGVHPGPWLLHSHPGSSLYICHNASSCLQCVCTVLKHNSAICLRIKAWKFLQGLDAPFLYGSHYSCPGYVMFWMVRAAPAHLLRCALPMLSPSL